MRCNKTHDGRRLTIRGNSRGFDIGLVLTGVYRHIPGRSTFGFLVPWYREIESVLHRDEWELLSIDCNDKKTLDSVPLSVITDSAA